MDSEQMDKVTSEDLKAAFDSADINKDGLLSVKEIKKFLVRNGVPITRAQSFKLMINPNKKMNFEKFCSVYNNTQAKLTRSKSEISVIENYKRIFKFLDEDGDGHVTKNELKARMQMIGQNLTEKQVDDMIKIADKNKDSTIDFDEFVLLMNQLSLKRKKRSSSSSGQQSKKDETKIENKETKDVACMPDSSNGEQSKETSKKPPPMKIFPPIKIMIENQEITPL